MKADLHLERFSRRVRALRAWYGLAIGGTVGAVLAAAWSTLDLFRIWYTDWIWLGIVVVSGAAVGAVLGATLRLSEKTLAASIDRRACLKDRLSTSVAGIQESSFTQIQQSDAEASLTGLRASQVFPVRMTRWHGGLILACVLASAVFLLGNSPLLLSEEQKKDRAELQKVAAALERVAKPLLEKPDKDLEEKELASKLMQYQAELQKGRLNKEEALQKANDLAKQADDLSKRKFEKSDQSIATAQKALSKMAEQALEKNGLGKVDPQMSQKSPEAAQSELDALKAQAATIQKELDSNKDSSGNKLTAQQKAGLTEQLKKLEHQIELSQKALDFLNKLHSQPQFKELQELLQKMANGSKPGKGQQLTDEQIREMIKKLEELADKHMSDKEMQQLLKDMIEALKQMKEGKQTEGVCLACLDLLQLHTYGTPSPGNGQELYFANNHQLPLTDKPKDIKAKALPLGVTGDRQEGGSETYIQTKGPSGLGSKSKVPYFKVLPKYRKAAEQALDREQIPPEDQKRVKDYFDSLEGQGK